MTQRAQSIERTRRHIRPEMSAWLILLGFFMLFCAIVAGFGYAGWRYYSLAMTKMDGMLRVHVNAGVSFQPRGSAQAVSLDRQRDACPDSDKICKPMSEGARVTTKPEAGYGPVASIVLPDQTQVDLSAHPIGAVLTLERYHVTRWTSRRQEVVFNQEAGYARYDVRSDQPYDQVSYTVRISDGIQVILSPGGSYSIYVPRPEPDKALARVDSGALMLAEVAARSGAITVRRGEQVVRLAPGEKSQIDVAGNIGSPIPAQWELIADGDFSQYAAQNRYNPGSSTWLKYWNAPPGITDQERNGQFSVELKCRPQTPDLCESPADRINIGQFRREGNQTKPFITGIQQELDADVSEYSSLRLIGWVRVIKQSIKGTGAAGSECPIMIHLTYKETSPTDQERRRFFCVYIPESEADTMPQDVGEIKYRPVPEFQWWYLEVDLRKDPLVGQARYLQMIRIDARGHDYLSEITDISLIGAQR